MSLTEQMLSGLPGHPLAGLQRADDLWLRYRTGNLPEQQVIHPTETLLESVEWDVVICGGTLGVLVGAGLAQRGWRVALLERGPLQGREQEWNISRRELAALTELGLLTLDELDAVIASEYNPARIQFGDGELLWVEDVLNVGVDPKGLLERLKAKFLAAGGKLFEHTAFDSAQVHPNGVAVTAGQLFTTRLLIDAMGHFSPLVQQARGNAKPDAVCLVVGTCAQGYAQNDTGDLIASFTPLRHQCQYFWEAFPARDGRTTYMFTYTDADPRRLSLTDFFEEYWTLLPDYQGVSLADLRVQRALFGFFPCYRDSPLRYPWGRTLAVGDSSGSQSPLSFGGFGAMIRHLERLVAGIDEALGCDRLDSTALGALQPYQPNLSVTWLFQKSMSVGMDQTLAEQHINRMLTAIFAAMAGLGEPTLKPFLQDVVQFPALAKTLAVTSLKYPALVAKIIPQVGLGALVSWLGHYSNLAGYSALEPLARVLSPVIESLPPVPRYYSHRWRDRLLYGSGKDYDV
ncbi:FAD-dependent oxidoreductase [Phormidium tenue]|uniref:FAD-dependent oxidoreductase n=1 Tax=Phormidium tenue NIES-30 TaxID=549789 RepID=A0A1U7J1R2_9CYAN|nr:FAD-dependent oxidoreductase [Phormidium tenue]MBD2232229.1 FAD-binding oxidoreductase [Phormidium tenue FACHB-1052]OKH45832.1 FAD-dependent oxidoreductase [Phormidium tenue NIES-30]